MKGISHHDKIVLLGSCFSDQIGSKFAANGFRSLVNPGGTIFHPLAILHLIQWAMDPNFKPLRVYQHQDIYFSWDLSGTFSAMSESELHQKSAVLHQELHEELKTSKFLFLTFGTSWGYELCTDGWLVANCHKAPQTMFEKKMADVSMMTASWEELIKKIRQFNPALELIFTISPVRHLKEGLIENNRSKARLHLLIEHITALQNCSYLASYELVLDELRDYKFFKVDKAHPNEEAINEVWNLVKQELISVESIQIIEKWNEIQRLKAHEILYPESMSAKRLQENIIQKEEEFIKMYPAFLLPTLS
jgi:hypothetical protein